MVEQWKCVCIVYVTISVSSYESYLLKVGKFIIWTLTRGSSEQEQDSRSTPAAV